MVNPSTDDKVRELRVDKIRQIHKGFVNALKKATHAGFEEGEIHVFNSYLFHQFLSPRINCRKDTYGGVLENRGSFLVGNGGGYSKRTALRRTDPCPLELTKHISGRYRDEEVVQVYKALRCLGSSQF